MFTFIAGATTTGAVEARYNVVRKSSAMPCANFARMSAVAGATSNRSVRCATAICSIAESRFASPPASGPANRSVMTFCPLSAANVSGVTNSRAPRVITTCTLKSSCCNRRTSSAALYAATPPVTPSVMRSGFMVVVTCDWRKLLLTVLLVRCQSDRDLHLPVAIYRIAISGVHLNSAIWEAIAATGLLHELDAQGPAAFPESGRRSAELLAALVAVLVFVDRIGLGEIVFDIPVIELLARDARWLQRARIFHQRRRSSHNLPRTSRCQHHIRKLALGSFG